MEVLSCHLTSYTALTEVEAIVNSRSISYLSNEDLEESLTPSHLIIGHHVLSLPDSTRATADINDEDFVLSFEDLNTKAQRLTRALEDYCRYLYILRCSHLSAQEVWPIALILSVTLPVVRAVTFKEVFPSKTLNRCSLKTF